MEKEQQHAGPGVQFYTPAQAVKYLREERGIDITVAGLRTRRKRKQVSTGFIVGNIALWTKEELDAVGPIKPRGRQKAKGDGDNEEENEDTTSDVGFLIAFDEEGV